jgi:hypothetical protein
MARRYIDRNLLGEEEQEKIVNVVESEKIDDLGKDVSDLRIENKRLEGEIFKLRQQTEQRKGKDSRLNKVFEELSKHREMLKRLDHNTSS